LVLRQHLSVSHGRVVRLMRTTAAAGRAPQAVARLHRRNHAATPSRHRRGPGRAERHVMPEQADRLYDADLTQHLTSEGRYYLVVVLGCFSRRSPAVRWRRTAAPTWSSSMR
jgi:putative transposase